jgi:hypothetical protein
MILESWRRLVAWSSSRTARRALHGALPPWAHAPLSNVDTSSSRAPSGLDEYKRGLRALSAAAAAPLGDAERGSVLALWDASGLSPHRLAFVALLIRDPALAGEAGARAGAQGPRPATPRELAIARQFTLQIDWWKPSPSGRPPTLDALLVALASSLGHGANDAVASFRRASEAAELGLAAGPGSARPRPRPRL